MRLEEAVLAECCRVTPDLERLRTSLSGPINWPLLRDLAKWHGLRPLLAEQIEGNCEYVAPATRKQLRQDARIVACRNLSLVAELAKILGLLSAQGVAAFSLKGPSLAIAAYGDVATREFGDLDIFVRKGEFIKAACILQQLGYEADVNIAGAEQLYLAANHQLALTNVPSGIRVELHWSLQEGKFLGVDIKSDEWWDRLQLTTICGNSISNLAPADLILFLCAHGAKHAWERWKWICDLSGLIRRCSPDVWDVVLDNALRLHAAPVLLLGLALASDFTGAALPAVIRQAIEDEKAFGRRLKFTKRCMYMASAAPVLAAAMLQLQMHNGLKAQAEYVRRHLFVPTAGDWDKFKLRPPFLFLYPALRPIRLATERLLAGVGRSNRGPGLGPVDR